MRFFNTAGPISTDRHYYIPPLERWDLDEVLMLIDQGKYFVLHAPRQTGKTSALLALMEHLNKEGRYKAAYGNVEAGQALRGDVEKAIPAVVQAIARGVSSYAGDTYLMSRWTELRASSEPGQLLAEALTEWCEQSAKPVVLMLDEIDSLVGDTLVSVLRQLRAGYTSRPRSFPLSVILCGVRDVRDYRLHLSNNEVITGGSAFNIKAESLRLGNFDRGQIERLYEMHTQETGQVFEPETFDQAWELTEGQPWLVNALAYEVTYKMEANRDRSRPIAGAMIREAAERLIRRRETHLDQLIDKLKEPRVRRVIHPILAGDNKIDKIRDDDVQYVVDLGLIHDRPSLRIANAMYREVIPRALTYTTQIQITHETAWYAGDGGRLDMPRLLTAFQQFFREHSESWIQTFDYHEAGPQLLLQAFLQRIVNAGGTINREYGLGRGRTDLLVVWPVGEHPAPDAVQRIVLELKIQRGTREAVIAAGLPQTAQYADQAGADECHLIVFDRTPDRTWDEKIFSRTETHEGRTIGVWGM